ncbi:MAG: hypothetical protein ACREQW_14450 [Candidatus Binatia bacterium]
MLRAFRWFRIGAELSGHGIIVLPLLGVVAFARGGIVIVMAVLYGLFAVGAVLHRRWAWWLGLLAAVVNGLLLVGIVMEGETIARALVWIVAPTILTCYLLSSAGREAFGR